MIATHSLTAGLAAVVLTGPLFAQFQLQAQPAAPAKRVHYSMATGAVTRVADDVGSIQAMVTEVVTLDNTAFSGFFYAPGTTEELADYGRTEPAQNPDVFFDYGGPVCEFTVGYATEEVDDPLNPPVSLEVAFYGGFGDSGNCDQTVYPGTGLGNEVARFTITGLPGDDNPSDGLAAGWETTIDLRGVQDGGFVLRPGSVTWTVEVLSDPALTGPLLVTPAAEGCSPPNSNPLPGTSDCFDAFFPGGGGGACVGTFSFQTPNIASFFMRVVQVQLASPPPTSRSAGAPGAMLLDVTPIDRGMFAGCDNISIPCPEAFVIPLLGPSVLEFWSFSRSPVDLPIPGIQGNLLIELPPILELIGGPNSFFQVPGIPASCDLVGLPIYSQGGYVDAVTLQINLSDSLDFVIGTYSV